MPEYIFRMPRNTPRLDYDSLAAWLRTHRSGKIGTTVTVKWHGGQERSREAALPPAIDLYLYGTWIAHIMPSSVYFPVHGDTHMATTHWLDQIAWDNHLGGRVWRVRRRVNDPLLPGPRGYCGPLCLNGYRSMPIEGHTYQRRERTQSA